LTERIGPKFPKSTAEPGLASHASVCQPTAKHEGGSSKAASQRYTTLQFHRSAVALGKGAFGWISAHERTLSALSMIGGFVFDNYAFRRIDLPNTQLVFVGYLALAGLSIIVLHWLAAREQRGKTMPRWHTVLPMATQFALGALWSAFLVFYSRGAVLAASWPFLLVLVAIFTGNEIFKRYHSRLVFTAILYFFALFSYVIVTLPIVTRSIGMITFLASGLAALVLFRAFLWLLRAAGREQWRKVRWQIAAGALLVYAALNAFYFTGILPPLPLALADAGIYHSVAKTGNVYKAVSEAQSWRTKFGAPPVVHVTPSDSLYLYSAVFAPIKLQTRIVHRWMHYEQKRKKWLTVSTVSFGIVGGRDGGYRGYSIHGRPMAGDWRVDIDTADGHIIGRVKFSVQVVPQSPRLTTRVLS